ncbi:MAG: MFS transporter [Gammaproteobacteria bacterium]|jgi:ATP-dependent protease HslVU (ClpYQ) peptidase subunit|nr:MFS transporter [Gammaproteobacteria bacterium]
MSTVVAVRKGSHASIAADTLTTFGDTRLASHYEMAHDKIRRFGDSYMGMVGSAAHHIVMENLLGGSGSSTRFGSRLEIFETLLTLHPTLKEKYFLNPKDEDDDPYESSRMDALIVNPHGVFAFYSMREVFEYSRFWAIGSGAEFALGAMHALYDRLDEADAIARAGVEAGAEFNNATSLPMTRYTVRLD